MAHISEDDRNQMKKTWKQDWEDGMRRNQVHIDVIYNRESIALRFANKNLF